MELPLFFAKDISVNNFFFSLDENNSRHCIQVLRMQAGDQLILTNGRGGKFLATIVEAHKKHCRVNIIEGQQIPEPAVKLAIGIAFTKQKSRMEWFLEKVTEIGITDIYPLLCERTGKEKFNASRFHNILVAAMLQSQQYYLPHLHEPLNFSDLLLLQHYQQLFIAWCGEKEKEYLNNCIKGGINSMVLIGPEGDFTNEEVKLAQEQNAKLISLGNNRLRTETAGIVAAIFLQAAQQK